MPRSTRNRLRSIDDAETMKALLVVIYPLLLLAGLVNRLRGRNHLRLREIPEQTFWIERRGQPGTASYFSELSCAQGGHEPTAARSLTRLFRMIGRLYTPPRQATGMIYKPSAEREKDIPDEIYTLW